MPDVPIDTLLPALPDTWRHKLDQLRGTGAWIALTPLHSHEHVEKIGTPGIFPGL